jgi:hypothetical protein
MNPSFPTFLKVRNKIININSISFINEYDDQSSRNFYITFHMKCGEQIEFKYDDKAERQKILDSIFKFYLPLE